MKMALLAGVVLALHGAFCFEFLSRNANPDRTNVFHRKSERSNELINRQREKFLKRLHEQFAASEELASSTFRPQIVGGTSASQGMLPWQVGLVLVPSGWLFCGGSIINSSWVLTAAHCVDHGPFHDPKQLVVFAGSTTLYTGGRGIGVRQIILYPRFNPVTDDNDIALLQLSSPVDSSWMIKLVDETSEASLTAAGSRGLVSGWGFTSEAGLPSRTLSFVDVPFVSREVCNAALGGKVTGNMLCAGEQGKDACNGDSGGPLVSPFSSPLSYAQVRLVGIVSFGEGCARADKYGVYTRVRNYLDWIKSTTTANQQASRSAL